VEFFCYASALVAFEIFWFIQKSSFGSVSESCSDFKIISLIFWHLTTERSNIYIPSFFGACYVFVSLNYTVSYVICVSFIRYPMKCFFVQ